MLGPILKFKWLMGFFKSMAPQEQTNKGLVTVIFYLSAALKHSHYSQIRPQFQIAVMSQTSPS